MNPSINNKTSSPESWIAHHINNRFYLTIYILLALSSSGLVKKASASNEVACPSFVSSGSKFELHEAKACEKENSYFNAGWIYMALNDCSKSTENYLKANSSSAYTNLIINNMYERNSCYDEDNWRENTEKYFKEALKKFPYDTGILELRGEYENLIYSYDSYRWFLKAFLSEPIGTWEKERHSEARSNLYDNNKYYLVSVLTQELKKDSSRWKKGNSEAKEDIKNWIIKDLDPKDSFADLEYLNKVIGWSSSQLHYVKGQQYLSGHYELYNPKKAYVHFLISGKQGLLKGAQTARELSKSLEKDEIAEATCLAGFNPKESTNFIQDWYCSQ